MSAPAAPLPDANAAAPAPMADPSANQAVAAVADAGSGLFSSLKKMVTGEGGRRRMSASRKRDLRRKLRRAGSALDAMSGATRKNRSKKHSRKSRKGGRKHSRRH